MRKIRGTKSRRAVGKPTDLPRSELLEPRRLLTAVPSDAPMQFVLNPTNGLALSQSFLTAAVSEAMVEWDNATPRILFTALQVNASAPGPGQDAQNTITFAAKGLNGIVSQTSRFLGGSGQVIEADIEFNTSYLLGDASLASVFDVEGLTAHELGHALGFDDSAGADDTMHFSLATGETKKRTLAYGDENALWAVQGTPSAYQQDSGSDKLVVIEAEAYDARSAGAVNSWTEVTNAAYSGSKAMRATPDVGEGYDAPDIETLSPRLDYRVNFVQTGVHTVWLRGLAPGGDDDSVHIGLDGTVSSTADRMYGFGTPVNWHHATMDGPFATINVTTAGWHTLNLWMREDGVVIDKLLLTSNPGLATPTGTGPAVSARTIETVLGSTLSNSWDVRNSEDGLNWEVLKEARVTHLIPKSGTPAVLFDLMGGDDALTIDYVNGNPTTGAQLRYAGNAGADELMVTGSSGADAVRVIGNNNGPEPVSTIVVERDVENLTVTGGGANDVIQIDLEVGWTLVDVQGGLGADEFVADGAYTLVYADAILLDAPGPGGSGTADYSEFETLSLRGEGWVLGTLTCANLKVLSGQFSIDADQHLNRLEIAGQVWIGDQYPGTGDVVIRCNELVFTPAQFHFVDMQSSDLIIDYSGSSPMGSWNGSGYTGLLGLVASGRNDGPLWLGSGIYSSAAWQSNGSMALGIAEASEALGISGSQTALWGGQTVDATCVLIKYTYAGDANLSGYIDIDDYTLIDSNASLGGILAGWFNGDFDYNGVVDIDDYTIIDSVFPIQGPPM